MGISRLKRLLSEDFYRAFNLSELKHFSWTIEPNLDLYKLTGYPANLTIPIKEAAKEVIEYFFKKQKIIPLLNQVIHAAKVGFKGEKVVFNNLKHILQEIKECGYNYKPEINKVVIIEQDEKRSDWGFLQDGVNYNFCFVSIDICGNSKLFRKYDTDSIRKTYLNFKNLIKSIVEKRDGRIWQWEGDGGLCAFHNKDFINSAVMSSIDILSALPIFNATSSFIDEDITIRIGINSGTTEFKNDTEMIDSEAIIKTKLIEKKFTYPLTISISQNTFQNVNPTIKHYFKLETINNEPICNLRPPLLGVCIEL